MLKGRTRSSYGRSTLPKLPIIPDVSVEDLNTEVGNVVNQPLGTKAKIADKEAKQSSQYGCASTWPPRKADWRRVVHEWMSLKEEIDPLADQPPLTDKPKEGPVREQSQVPELQVLEHKPAGSLLLEWQDRFNRSSEDSGKPSSNASTLVPPSCHKNKFNLPPPPPDWVPPKSAWSDTTASSIRERDGRGLRSRLRSLSLTRALRRVMERSPSPSRSTDTKIAQILDDHDARLSVVRAETHHKIVSKKVKRRSASDTDAKPKQPYQNVLEASEMLKKRLFRRSVPDEKELLGSGSEETVDEKERPKSLPSSRAPKLKPSTVVVPWV